MELATLHQAQRLEDRISLTDLRDLVRADADRSHDYRGIRLRDTHVSQIGNWHFNGHGAPLTRHALSQLCARLPLPDGGTIPASYLARCPEHLLDENLNHWVRRDRRCDILA